MSDQDKIFRLIKIIEILLGQVDQSLVNDWGLQTHVVANERRCVQKFLKAAEEYEKVVPLFKAFMFEWKIWNFQWKTYDLKLRKRKFLKFPVFYPALKVSKIHSFSIPYPAITRPQTILKTAVKLIRIVAWEIRKDIDYSPDILSVIKMDNGGNRFYDRSGRMISEIHQGEWPNDRFAGGAEIVMSRYVFTQEEAKRWKEDIEAWLMREYSGCPGEIKTRIGARPL